VEERKIAAAPVSEVVRKNWREIILSCLLRTGEQAPFYIFTVFVLSYGTTILGMDRQQILNYTLVAAAVSLVMVPLWGHVSDLIGRRRMYVIGAVVMAVFAWLYFPLLDSRVSALMLLAIVASLIAHDMMYGPQAAFIAEAFPPRLRYSGSSLGYQLASLTAGGPAPLIATWLLAKYNSSTPIALYICICAVISVISAAALHDRTRADVTVEHEEADGRLAPA
jgi:MFS family permease